MKHKIKGIILMDIISHIELANENQNIYVYYLYSNTPEVLAYNKSNMQKIYMKMLSQAKDFIEEVKNTPDTQDSLNKKQKKALIRLFLGVGASVAALTTLAFTKHNVVWGISLFTMMINIRHWFLYAESRVGYVTSSKKEKDFQKYSYFMEHLLFLSQEEREIILMQRMDWLEQKELESITEGNSVLIK